MTVVRKRRSALPEPRFGLRLIREAGASYPNVLIRRPADAFHAVARMADHEIVEVFWIIALDAQHGMIGGAPIEISRGILNATLVNPQEVFTAAYVARARSVILAHNHPSGNPDPSPDDQYITNDLVRAGELFGVPVRDHIIVGCGRYVSFVESGLLSPSFERGLI